jgi:glutamate racemase
MTHRVAIPGASGYTGADLVRLGATHKDDLARRPEFPGPGTGARFLTTGDPARGASRAMRFLRRMVVFEAA